MIKNVMEVHPMSNSIANPISTEDQKVNTPSKTYDFVVLFDCKNGNPQRRSRSGQYAPPQHLHR